MKRLIKDLNVLRKPSEPLEFITETGVDKAEGLEIINQLLEVMNKHKEFTALAAPQIGIKKRIFCIRFSDTIKAFINPIITKKIGNSVCVETAVFMPGKEILIARPEEITAVYYTEDFKYEDNKLLGAAAQLFDQQAQLLDGILPDDLGLVSDIEQDGSLADATEEEMRQYVEMYKKYIEAKTSAYLSTISEEEKLTYRQLKFAEDVITGKTQVVENQKTFANRAQRRAAEKQNRRIQKKVAKRNKGAQ